jgi:hypothetical protein
VVSLFNAVGNIVCVRTYRDRKLMNLLTFSRQSFEAKSRDLRVVYILRNSDHTNKMKSPTEARPGSKGVTHKSKMQMCNHQIKIGSLKEPETGRLLHIFLPLPAISFVVFAYVVPPRHTRLFAIKTKVALCLSSRAPFLRLEDCGRRRSYLLPSVRNAKGQ